MPSGLSHFFLTKGRLPRGYFGRAAAAARSGLHQLPPVFDPVGGYLLPLVFLRAGGWRGGGHARHRAGDPVRDERARRERRERRRGSRAARGRRVALADRGGGEIGCVPAARADDGP